MTKLPDGKELENCCRALGVDIEGEPRTRSSAGSNPRASDHELQRRLIEAKRSVRESRLWLIAVISAVASVCSAIAAIVAVVMN